MSRETSKFVGVRLATSLIEFVDKARDSGDSKRNQYERALRRELGLDTVPTSTATQPELFDPITADSGPSATSSDSPARDVSAFLTGTAKVSGVTLGDSVRAACEQAVKNGAYSTNRELFEYALMREVGLLPPRPNSTDPGTPVLPFPAPTKGLIDRMSA